MHLRPVTALPSSGATLHKNDIFWQFFNNIFRNNQIKQKRRV